MEIHNIVEDLVCKTVTDLFRDEDRSKRLGYCTCDQCRMDVICYALNKMTPEYLVSGRGLAYASSEYQDNIQRVADAVSLANEGWKQINQTKRTHVDHAFGKQRAVRYPDPPVFNYPTILGRIFNGTTFDPMNAIQISLLRDGKLISMIDPNWQNPCSVFANTSGTFIFWPEPEKADSLGESKTVEFNLKATAEGFEDFSHFFELRIHGESSVQNQFSSQRQYTLPDLTMFPVGSDEEDE
jgi:competence protein ComFB